MSGVRKIIYDFGANNGDDIPYYLLKGDVVVAVEANPSLCEHMRAKYEQEIEEGRVVIENCVITNGPSDEDVDFYLHDIHMLSKFVKPSPNEANLFKKVTLRSRNILDIIKKHGYPYYFKTDVEGYDHIVLKTLFSGGYHPAFISAEAHSLDIFCILVCLGDYRSFKLVDAPTVSKVYENCEVKTANGPVRFSFEPHSAGPFGEDILGPWMSDVTFMKHMSEVGFGWKDIHGTREFRAEI